MLQDNSFVTRLVRKINKFQLKRSLGYPDYDGQLNNTDELQRDIFSGINNCFFIDVRIKWNFSK